MKKEVADAWIADLRTNPPQTTGVLYDGKGYCCLGRLCVVLGREFFKGNYDGWDDGYYCEEERMLLPNSIQIEAGMHSSSGVIDEGMKCPQSLIILNDSGRTFDEIAYAIEKHWEIL